jgi:hypothetical protein
LATDSFRQVREHLTETMVSLNKFAIILRTLILKKGFFKMEVVTGTKKDKKKLCKLYYQDKILELYQEGKSIRQITDYINKQCIPHSKFCGLTLGKTTIHQLIKKGKNVR